MSDPSPAANARIHRGDPFFDGQMLLVIAAVAAAVTFAFLYIKATRKPAPHAPVAGQSAADPARSASVVPATRAASHEPTRVEVEQVVLIRPDQGAAEKVLVRAPAVFANGTVQWEAGQVARARNLQDRIAAVLRHQEAIAREIDRLESEWRELVREGVPAAVLYPGSASLPEPEPDAAAAADAPAPTP